MGRHNKYFRAKDGTAAHLHERFYVITVISNSRRFRSRYELYNEFSEHIEDLGGTLYTVELQFGRRAHTITDAHNPRHIQLRTSAELWHKEQLINLAINRLPDDWKYVAWIDADIQFARPDVVNETVQMLQHHPVVQMFSEAHDLDPDYQIIARHESFACSHEKNRPRHRFGHSYYAQQQHRPGGPVHHWHPGFAWAARRDFFDGNQDKQGVGPLIDWAVLGAADNHMAHALIGDALRSCHPDMSAGYRDRLIRWQNAAEKHARRKLGYVKGTILHGWHGKKVDRKYWDRWKILVDNGFDPNTDLIRDSAGLYKLVDDGSQRHLGLRDGIMKYFQQRNEDSIDL